MMVEKLLKYVPLHRIYVEVFGGGASLLFAKDPAPVEVYNDIDEGLVNFFRVLRDPEKFGKFYARVVLSPYSKTEYRDGTWQGCEDDIERAYRWFVAVRMSLNESLRKECSNVTKLHKGMAEAVPKLLSVLEELPAIYERFMRVQIECLDFRKVIPKYDTEATFFYLDLPLYNYEMAIEDHMDLVKILLNIKGMAMISGYQNNIYQELEKNGWLRKDFEVVRKVPQIESIWLNPQAISKLEENSKELEEKDLGGETKTYEKPYKLGGW